jgi:hypothetical protein
MPTPELHTWLITGTSPLMQSNPQSMWAEPEPESDGSAKTSKARKPMYSGQTEAFKIAEGQLYRDDGGFYHPAQAFFDVLLLASRIRKLGTSKAIEIITQGVRIPNQEFRLCKPLVNGRKKMSVLTEKNWMVDKRRAVNHNKNEARGGVAVVAIRPKWKNWGGVLGLELDMDLFKALGGLTDLLHIGGVAFGIGVGRRRITGIRSNRELWGDCGMGRFTAELIE